MASYSTEQKRLIETFLDTHGECGFTVEQLIGVIARENPGETPPAVSTVYRLMQRLVLSGRVRRYAKDTGRRFLYQSVCNGRDHLHLRCTACDKLLHVDAETSGKVLHLLNNGQFRVDGGQTVLAGTCGDCLQPEGGTR